MESSQNYFKSALLQTGRDERNVYVVPPPESSECCKSYWLLLTAAYLLVNATAKWQAYSDNLLYKLGLCQVIQVSQLFYLESKGKVCVIALRILDDDLLTEISSILKSKVSMIEGTYALGTVVFSSGTFLSFPLQVIQDEIFEIPIDADQKLESLKSIDTTRQRQKEI